MLEVANGGLRFFFTYPKTIIFRNCIKQKNDEISCLTNQKTTRIPFDRSQQEFSNGINVIL